MGISRMEGRSGRSESVEMVWITPEGGNLSTQNEL
jgi:hypothetical protein